MFLGCLFHLGATEHHNKESSKDNLALLQEYNRKLSRKDLKNLIRANFLPEKSIIKIHSMIIDSATRSKINEFITIDSVHLNDLFRKSFEKQSRSLLIESLHTFRNSLMKISFVDLHDHISKIIEDMNSSEDAADDLILKQEEVNELLRDVLNECKNLKSSFENDLTKRLKSVDAIGKKNSKNESSKNKPKVVSELDHGKIIGNPLKVGGNRNEIGSPNVLGRSIKRNVSYQDEIFSHVRPIKFDSIYKKEISCDALRNEVKKLLETEKPKESQGHVFGVRSRVRIKDEKFDDYPFKQERLVCSIL